MCFRRWREKQKKAEKEYRRFQAMKSKDMLDHELKEHLKETQKYGFGPEAPIRKELETMAKDLSEILQILRHFDARARGVEP